MHGLLEVVKRESDKPQSFEQFFGAVVSCRSLAVARKYYLRSSCVRPHPAFGGFSLLVFFVLFLNAKVGLVCVVDLKF